MRAAWEEVLEAADGLSRAAAGQRSRQASVTADEARAACGSLRDLERRDAAAARARAWAAVVRYMDGRGAAVFSAADYHAAARSRSRVAVAVRAAGRGPLTFGEAVAARPSTADRTRPGHSGGSGRGEVPPGLPWRRIAATVRGVRARSYDTRIFEFVPVSVPEFVAEAAGAACTYYENLLNGGCPFPPAGAFPGAVAGRGDLAPDGGALAAFAAAAGLRLDEGPQSRHPVLVAAAVSRRVDAAVRGIAAAVRCGRMADGVPATVAAFYVEATGVACTYYEDLLNDGDLFKQAPGSAPPAYARANARRAELAGRRDADRAAVILAGLGDRCRPDYRAVAEARIAAPDASWSQIAEGLGMSKDAAIGKFRRLRQACGAASRR